MTEIYYSNVLYMLPSLFSSTNCEQNGESEVGLIYPSVVCHKSRHTLPHSIIKVDKID